MGSHPFQNLPEGKLENLNALQAHLAANTSPDKLNLMYGVFRPDDGNPQVLPSVQKAKSQLFNDEGWHHEYPPSHLGTVGFRRETVKLLFGNDHPLIYFNRIVTMQALGASGACHMGALFLKNNYEPWRHGLVDPVVYVPLPSWENHPNVFTSLGLSFKPIPWYDSLSCGFAFSALVKVLHEIPERSVVVLQTSSHNPTGCDPTNSEWHELASIFKQRNLFAFLDAAYLGFVSGSAYSDAESVRIFADGDIPLLLATTYSKAFGLYGERVGSLSILAPSPEIGARIEIQMKLMARAETGAQPVFGAKLVEMILQDQDLRHIWEQDVEMIAAAIKHRRRRLRTRLEHLQAPVTTSWEFLTEQHGIFSIIPLAPDEINMLREDFNIYVQSNGRVSFGAVNDTNIDRFAEALVSIISKKVGLQMAHFRRSWENDIRQRLQ